MLMDLFLRVRIVGKNEPWVCELFHRGCGENGIGARLPAPRESSVIEWVDDPYQDGKSSERDSREENADALEFTLDALYPVVR